MWPFKPPPDESFRSGLTEMESRNFKEACTQFSKVIETENRLKTEESRGVSPWCSP